MECKNVNKKLIFYIENDLSEKEHNEIKNHLTDCKECNSKFVFLMHSVKQIEEQKQISPNDFIATRILAKLPETRERSNLRKVFYPVFVSIIILVAVFLGKLTADIYNSKTKEIYQTTYNSPDTLDQYVFTDLDYSNYYYLENQ